MPSKKWLIIPWVFVVIGTVVLLFGYGNYKSTEQFLHTAVKTIGKVVDVKTLYDSEDSSTTYAPVITYTDRKGQVHTFTSSNSSNPPSYAVGERVELLYDPSKPDQPTMNTWIDIYIGTLVLGILGGIDVLISGGVLYFYYRRQRKIVWLQQNGKLISAQVNAVSFNTNFKVNGRSPYLITAQWEDTATNTVHVFRSDNIWFDPSQYVKEKIEVWIDPNNPKSYYMKTDFLPNAV